MRTENAEGIVLRAWPFAESHRVVMYLTPDRGVCRGVAHGAQKPQHPNHALTQSLNRCLLQMRAQNHGLHEIRQGQVLDSYDPVKSDIVRMTYALAMCELIMKVAEVEPLRDPRTVYAVCCKGLTEMAQRREPLQALVQLQLVVAKELGLGNDPQQWIVPMGDEVLKVLLQWSRKDIDFWSEHPDKHLLRAVSGALAHEMDDRAGITLKSLRVLMAMDGN